MLENNSMLKKVVSGILLLAIVLVVTVLVVSYFRKNKVEIKPQPVVSHAPVRTDYKGALPPLFPETIPVRKTDTLKQSYAMDYGTLKQSSIVVSSKESINTVISFYNDVLIKDGYVIATTTKLTSSTVIAANKVDSRVEVTIVDMSNFAKKEGEKEVAPINKTYILINVYKK